MAAGGDPDPHFPEFAHKGLVEFDGRSSIQRTIEACLDAEFGSIVLAANPEVRASLNLTGEVKEAKAGSTNIQTVRSGLAQLKEQDAILFLPVDTPLIFANHLLDFIQALGSRSKVPIWFAAGLSSKETVDKYAPQAPYKYLRLKEGQFASGALFAASRSGFELALDRIESVAGSRKSMLSMLRKVGFGTLFRYGIGRLDFPTIEMSAKRFLGGESIIVSDCHPATTLDYDNAADLAYIKENWERLLEDAS